MNAAVSDLTSMDLYLVPVAVSVVNSDDDLEERFFFFFLLGANGSDFFNNLVTFGFNKIGLAI